jgi:hypothetical protein
VFHAPRRLFLKYRADKQKSWGFSTLIRGVVRPAAYFLLACFVVYKRDKGLPFIGSVRAPDLISTPIPSRRRAFPSRSMRRISSTPLAPGNSGTMLSASPTTSTLTAKRVSGSHGRSGTLRIPRRSFSRIARSFRSSSAMTTTAPIRSTMSRICPWFTPSKEEMHEGNYSLGHCTDFTRKYLS